MKYKGQDLQVIVWEDGRPWPDAITIDGDRLEYAHEWENRSGSQIIYYRKPGELRMHGIDRKALLEART